MASTGRKASQDKDKHAAVSYPLNHDNDKIEIQAGLLSGPWHQGPVLGSGQGHNQTPRSTRLPPTETQENTGSLILRLQIGRRACTYYVASLEANRLNDGDHSLTSRI